MGGDFTHCLAVWCLTNLCVALRCLVLACSVTTFHDAFHLDLDSDRLIPLLSTAGTYIRPLIFPILTCEVNQSLYFRLPPFSMT